MSKSSTPRRQLHFADWQALLDEAQRCAAAEPEVLGSWSPGQILLHLARSIDGSIDGIPGFRLPWFLRMVGPLFKQRLLHAPLPRRVRIPEQAAEYLVPGPTTSTAGLQALREAIARWQKVTSSSAETPQLHLHPFLGRLTAAEWTQIHLRHAERHLSHILLS